MTLFLDDENTKSRRLASPYDAFLFVPMWIKKNQRDECFRVSDTLNKKAGHFENLFKKREFLKTETREKKT